MAKQKTRYVCQNCGSTFPQWSGKCDSCNSWNTLVEDNPTTGIGANPGKQMRKGNPVQLVSLAGESEQAPRITTGIQELDRATGGGFVEASALLIGGDPGIGKSTLLMQASAAVASQGAHVVYVSGEEAVSQIRMRATRLGSIEQNIGLAAETCVENILATLEAGSPPALLVIDSIQTLWTEQADSAPGTVTQVRNSAQALIRYAKNHGTCVVLVGHVTKDGQIAGPRVVEHMVDAVLYFEGEAAHNYRIMRTVKNRFGPTDEIGVFEMSDAGLREVANPSELFLGERNERAPGAAVFAGMEGTRPLLVEIQALVVQSSLGTPRRAVIGWDTSRLSMVLAVLEAHCGVKLGSHDVYLNVAGGYRIVEPAADLAVAAALVSSLCGVPLSSNSVFFGEISLSGSTRPVAHAAQRLKEAGKLGFTEASVSTPIDEEIKKTGMTTTHVRELTELAARIASLPKTAKEKS